MLLKILKNLTLQQIARLRFKPEANRTSQLKLRYCTILNKPATNGYARAYARRGFKPTADRESRLKTTKLVNFLSISVGFNRLERLARDLSPWRSMALNENAARFELKPTKNFISVVFRRLARLALEFIPGRAWMSQTDSPPVSSRGEDRKRGQIALYTKKWKFALIALFSLGLTILAPGLNELDNFGLGMRWVSLLNPQPVLAQLLRPQQAGPELYKRLPDFPQENTYVNRETGKVDLNNTLAVRLIGYHMYVKGRPPNYRLDWKLTLADYLGANELIEKTVYPGHELLKENPIEGDRAAINRLNRAQRDALINALVSIFNPQSAETSEPKAPAESSTSEPEPAPKPQLPQPGSADLLKAL